MSSSAPATLRRRCRPDSITGTTPPPSPNVDDLEAGEVRMEFRPVPLRVLLKRRFIQLLLLLFVVWFFMCKLAHYGVLSGRYLGLSACINVEFGYNPSTASIPAFEPPENSTYRAPDTIDTFQNYAWRNHSECQISSLDLHSAFSPLCATREDFLRAFSGGGRIGFDQPFIPLGCDMRWFTTEEVCEIFSRFEKVIVVGDSMMRHVVGALNVLLRKDLGYGAVTNWNFDDQELRDCFCNHQMDVKSCSVQGIFSTSSVLEHDPSSLSCSRESPIDLVIEMMLRFPLDNEEVNRYKALLSPTKPGKPPLPPVLRRGAETKQRAHSHSLWPRLFITPNAAGVRKPDEWLVSQGDKALMIFEESVRAEAAHRGVETMGTWNMSVQASKYDGVHLDLKGNLVKAMGVVNWLNLVDVHAW
ncbi:hypothetical protein CLAIMM_12577 [Cladophialophora immunda]|nr:hypothetical protein CLAIMM_12577 [Cladophialophora immunda]